MLQRAVLPFPEYFNSLSHALEVKSRTNSVNEKITYAAEVNIRKAAPFEYVECRGIGSIGPPTTPRGGTSYLFVFFMNGLTVFKSSSHRMELVIIALIAVEVVVVSPFPSLTSTTSDMCLTGPYTRWARAVAYVDNKRAS
jgi:hypothetical protein